MAIGGISSGYSLFPSYGAGGKSANAAVPGAGFDSDSKDPRDIIAQIASGGDSGLLKYQEKQIAEKTREAYLKKRNLTEADLKNLSPDKLATIDDAIAKAIKAALARAFGAAAQGTDATGQTQGTSSAGQAKGASETAGQTAAGQAAASSTGGFGADGAAQKPATPNVKSLISSVTLSALFDGV